MKKILHLFLLITISTICYGQSYNRINSSTLIKLIESSKLPSYILFYIPNCPVANKQTLKFCENYIKYSDKINYIIIAITNKDELIEKSILGNSIKVPIYVLENKNANNVENNYKLFTSEFCKYYKISDYNFSSLLIGNNKIYYKSLMNNVSLKKTKKLLKKIK